MIKAIRVNALVAGMALATMGSAFAAGGDNDRVWVKFKPGARGNVENALRNAGGRVHHTFDDIGAFAVSVPPQALNGLRRNPNIESIEPDQPRYPLAQSTPYGIDMVQAPQAWAAGGSGSNVLVCVIDSGINASHEDFASGQITGGYASNWNSDTCGHGTHVAGTVAAANNSVGVVGVAPNASLYIVRVFSGGTDGCAWGYASDVLDAANRCAQAGTAQGKRVVINMSLGGAGSSTAEGNGFQSLFNSGNVLSIAAAGNDGNTALSYPASYSSVMSVAAIDSNKALADFSQRNAQVEIAAPGVDIMSTMPFTDASLSVSGTSYVVAAMTDSFQGTASGALISGGRCTATNSAWSGKVVLCERGDIAFSDKMTNVQNSGGRAALIYNNVAGSFGGTLNGVSSTIPTLSLSQEDGQFLVANRIGITASVSSVKVNPANGYGLMSGTSMATPHVAGAAAAIWSAVPTATSADVRNAITSTAEDLGSAGRDTSFGYGLIRAANAIAALAPPDDTTAPTVPGSLTASAGSSNAISLSWTASTDSGGSGLSGYKIERCSGASCTTFVQVGTSATASFADSGLTASTTYRYRVRSYDGAGNHSGYSTIASATTQAAPPPNNVLQNGVAVTGLGASTGGELRYTLEVPAGSTNLSFVTSGGSGDADLYVKFGSAPSTSSYDCRPYQNGNSETCSFASPQAGTYHVMLRAYSTFANVSLTGSYSAAPLPDTTAPTVPASLSASAGSSSAVGLSWTASTDSGGSGLAGYKIERCSGASCTGFAQIGTSTTASYADSGLTAATTYRYRVRAYDGAGNHSGYSAIASATTDSVPPPSNVLQNGVTVSGLSAATNGELRYTMEVPAGASNLNFVTAGGTGDADMYVKFGSAPTTSSYDCRPYKSGNAETCTFAAPQAGTYHVMLRAYSSFSAVSLTGSYATSQPGFFENTADYAISDNATVESPITVSGRSGNAPSGLRVNVRIIHTYIGDLKVDLIAPDGSVYVLHNRSGGSADNIITTYTVNASSELANGTWKLRVNDNAGGDTGTIDSWSLQF